MLERVWRKGNPLQCWWECKLVQIGRAHVWTPVTSRSRMPSSAWKKKRKKKCWRGHGEKGTLLHCWWECKLVKLLWRTVWRFLKKLKIKLLNDPAIPLLGIYLEKTILWKDTCTPMFTAALLTIAKTWKQLKCPSMYEWIKKMWYVYRMEYYSAIKRMK